MSNTAVNTEKNKIYRVVQWASGRIGQSAMRATIGHPQRELVGLYVHSKEKAGRDAGELCGLEPIGVKATCEIADIIALKPDCVLYMQEGYNLDDISRLLEAGINIITTRSEFFYPKQMDTELRERIETACEKGGASLFATGASPGFSSEILPLAMVYMSRRLDCMTIDEFANIPASTSPAMITGMGFGKSMPGNFNPAILKHMAVGFAQSLGAVAEGLGLTLDGFETSGEFALANSPVTLPGGAIIETGTVAAMRITVAGKRQNKPLLQYRTNWYCSKDIDQDWELNDNGWRLLIEGDAPMQVDITFPASSATDSKTYADQMSGLTGHPAVNAVPYVCEAAPGIRSIVDLPLMMPKLG